MGLEREVISDQQGSLCKEGGGVAREGVFPIAIYRAFFCVLLKEATARTTPRAQVSQATGNIIIPPYCTPRPQNNNALEL